MSIADRFAPVGLIASALVGAWALPAGAEAPIQLEHVWSQLADPAGQIDGPFRNGIASGESAAFSQDGRLIVTTSKADGRMADPGGSPHGGTAHLRLFDLQGNLLWDKPRSRGADLNGDGRPDDQPASGEDELENAQFSRDDRYIAAGGDDKKIEIWQIRDNVDNLLAEPILVKTFNIGGGIDSLSYSHDGDLLFAGTEEAGKIEVFRVQGDPSTWQNIHKADHGGVNSNGVNSLDLTADDRFVASAGTNQTGVLWELDVTRDGGGLITAVDMIRLAQMNEPTSTTREIRFQPSADNSDGQRNEILPITAEHDQATYVYTLQQLLDQGTAGTSPAPLQILRNSDPGNTVGTPVEPMTFTRDGRFVIIGGKTGNIAGTPQIEIGPAFLRIYETAEILPGQPEPDPVYVQTTDVFNPEFLDVNPDNDKLTSSHHDGSVRLWNLTISGSRTLASEAFNEPTDQAGRWTLVGSRSTAAGNDEFGITNGVSGVNQSATDFIGHRGSRYVGVDNLAGETHALTMTAAWPINGFTQRQVQFAAAAAAGEFEAGDFLRLLADLDGDDVFETLIAEFLPDSAGNLVLDGVGQALTPTFEDFFIDLESLLPAGHGGSIRFRLEANTNTSREEIGFDSLRVTGVPEPAGLAMLGLTCLAILRRR